jgi:hypothetical protein
MRMALFPATAQDCKLLDLVMFKHLCALWLAAPSTAEAEVRARRFVQRRARTWPYANVEDVVSVCQEFFGASPS